MRTARGLAPVPDAVIQRLRAAASATNVNQARTWLPERPRWWRALRATWEWLGPGATGWSLPS